MGGSGIREFLLTPASERNLQVMRTVLQPGGGTGGAYSLDSETVFVFVIRGDLRLVVDGQESNLGAGDGFTFPAGAVHSWDNPGLEESEILWFIVPPLPNRL
jgi:quercetin dioxygenase-like cupin family protein